MASERPSEREILRKALAPAGDCPPIERLEACLDANAAPQDLMRHLESCGYCRTELDLLRSFHAGPRDAAEVEAVNLVAECLRTPRLPLGEGVSDPWWKRIFQTRWLSPALVVAASLLIAVAVGVQWRRTSIPYLHVPSQPDQEVLRSGTVKIVAPAGDIRVPPTLIQWQPVPDAAQYRVSLLEVDRTEIWSASTTEIQLDIPASEKAKILPAKTLLLQVVAFDSSGRKLAESQLVAFRLLQSIYVR
jgi:hypothetical protein